MNKVEELYRKQIEDCENELYKYLEAIQYMSFEAMNTHASLNERRNKLKEYLENETII